MIVQIQITKIENAKYLPVKKALISLFNQLIQAIVI